MVFHCDHVEIFESPLGLEGDGMLRFVGGFDELAAEAGHGVAVDAVGPKFGHELSGGFGEWLAFVVGAGVPGHDGEQHFHAVCVEVVDHRTHAGDAAGKVAHHVVLVAVVDADVRVDGPQQDGVDAAVAFVEVVEIAIDRVLAGRDVEEVAIFDHALRLDEGLLRPTQFGPIVLAAVVFQSFARGISP